MFFVKGGLGVIAVLSFACKLFEVSSSVTPQQIIKFAFGNKEPGSMYKHINTAALYTRLLIARRNFCFLIEYEMYYLFLYVYCASLARWKCGLQRQIPKCQAAVLPLQQ